MYTKLVTSNLIHSISRLSIRIFLLLLLLAVQKSSHSQLKYNFERITTENGLPTNAIKGLQFDEKNRFLWVATESGIVRFNGHGFQNFGDNDKTSVLNGRIVFFDKTINGKFFGKLIDERIFTIHENNAIIDNSLSKMEDEFSYLNYKYNIGLPISKQPFLGIENKDFKLNNTIYTINDHELFKYDHNKLIPLIKFKNEEEVFVINDQLFLIDKDGIILKAKFNLEKFITKNKVDLSKSFEIDSKNIFSKIKVFQNHSNESVYILNGEKLFLLTLINNQIKVNLITDQLPKNEFIKYVQIDNVTNVIYIGTDNRGLIVGRPQYFNRILPNNAIAGVSSSAYAQLQLSNGNIQINTGQIFGNSKVKSSNVFYRPSETSTFISSDSILFMTNSDGIVEYDLLKSRISTISKDINVNRNCLIQKDGIIYSFNEKGIALKKTKWEYVLKLDKMPFNFIVYSLMQINDNEILAATTHGLYKYNFKHNTFILYFKDNNNSNFRSIFNLNNYYLIGTYGGGVYMYHDDSIKKVPLDQNKYLNYSHCFIQDKKGNVWASTNKGLFMSPAQSLIDFWHKGPGNIRFKYFGKNEGIDQLEMNGGCNPCAIKMKNGNLSFPGIDGLIQFNPDSLQIIEIQPKVYVDKLYVDEKLINLDKFNNEFSSGVKNLEVQLGISGMLSQENIMLEYKFDNDKWIRINVKNPVIKYSNPEYGNHTFSIRLRNTINGKWDQVDYPYIINYPWTLNPFMYFVYFLSIVGVILLYIRFKTLIYQRRQKVLEKEVDAKTASLNNLNDYLLKRNQAKDHVIAIMNHDILTPLKYLHITAKNIADTTNDEKAKSSIKQIARTSKELEYLTSNMLNWVKFDNIEALPTKQTVDLCTIVNDLIEFVEPFKQNKSLKIINSIPEDLMIQNWPDSLRVLLYNIIINSINNSIKGEIRVSYTTTNNGYHISVNDTGVGMNASMIQHLLKGKSKDEVEQIPKYKKGNGVGFQIIRNIVHLMNAQLEIQSVENIGTTVSVIFMD
jgi:signal transduction histidine kinase